MSLNLSPALAQPGDFASGERTEPLTPEEISEDALQGDFASGERTEPLSPQELSEDALHGDFAAGERTADLTAADETPGSFADTEE